MDKPFTKTFGLRSTDQLLLSSRLVSWVTEQVSIRPSMARVALYSKVLDWIVELSKAALGIFSTKEKTTITHVKMTPVGVMLCTINVIGTKSIQLQDVNGLKL